MKLFRYTSAHLYAIGLIIACGIIGFAVDVAWTELQDSTARAAISAENNIDSVGMAVSRDIELYALSIQAVVDGVKDARIDALPPDLRHSVLFDRAATASGFGAILVLDASGNVFLDSENMIARRGNFADRDYFQVHRQSPDVGLFIGKPFKSRLNGLWAIGISRRLAYADGAFAGVVVGTIRLDLLARQLSEISLNRNDALTLFLRDGTIISQTPVVAGRVGGNVGASPNFVRMLNQERGKFTAVSTLDGVERAFTFRSLAPYPLFIVLGQSTDGLYAGWRRRAWFVAGIVLSLLAAGACLTWLLQREFDARQRAEASLKTASNDLQSVLDNVPALIGYWDANLRNRFANKAYQEWFGITPEDMRGRHAADVLGAELFAQNQPTMIRVLTGETQVVERDVVTPSGERRILQATYIPDRVDGKVVGMFALASDITRRRHAERALYDEKERIRITMDAIGDAVLTTDREGRVTHMNPAAENLTGWSLTDAVGRPGRDVLNLVHGVDRHEILNPIEIALRQNRVVSLDDQACLVRRDGGDLLIEDSAAPIHDSDGVTIGVVMVFRDVTASRTQAQRMSHLAQHDALTDLPNRALLQDRIEQALTRAGRERARHALMFLDLDHFKNINDTLGHIAGDELLIGVAQRLHAIVRKSDTVSRQGGDEFVILLENVQGEEEAVNVAKKVLADMRLPFPLRGHPVVISVSIGISLYPADSGSMEQLLRHADRAMYAAKQAGRNQYRVYSSQLAHDVARREPGPASNAGPDPGPDPGSRA